MGALVHVIPALSDHAGERVGEIGVEAGIVGGKDVADPCNSFVRDDTEIPDARDRVGVSLPSQRLGGVGRGEENVVVEFVFVFPPVDEDEVAAATVVYAEEANAVPSCCCGRVEEESLRRSLPRLLRTRVVRKDERKRSSNA